MAFTVVFMAFSTSSRGDFTNVHLFGAFPTSGIWPSANLMESGGLLYGMTPYGGVSNCGVLFRYSPSAGICSNLFLFNPSSGQYPLGSLLLYSNKLLGMTARGGSFNDGVIFETTTNGTSYTVRHHFDSTDSNNGGIPWGSLIEHSNFLYGMTYNGGISNNGVIFRIDPSTWSYTNIHLFLGGHGDGRHPQGDLMVDGHRFYGMTTQGGTNDSGVVFSMNTDGSHYTNLHEFTSDVDGANPSGGLLKDGAFLYGMTRGGPTKAGLIFAVPTNGGQLQILHVFTGTTNDGADPYGSLAKYGSKLYGFTRFGGTNSQGVIFSLGGTYTNIHSFGAGGEPYGTPLMVGNTAYGMAFNEGVSNRGSIFRFDPDSNDTATAWCAITWIDSGGMGSSLLGDENGSVIYVQHNTDALPPDQALAGFGRTPDKDDETWTWCPIYQRTELVGGNYEYTGTLGRAAATGDLFVAVKFIHGTHVYYPPAASSWNSWGDWNTPLFTTNRWHVDDLGPPTNVAATYVSDSSLALSFQNDGIHWVTIFRKDGRDPEFARPDPGVEYFSGTVYSAQGECIYHNVEGGFIDSGLLTTTTYHYVLYTENWGYYSPAAHVFATTDLGADYDGDTIPDWWEQQYFRSPTGAVASADSDADSLKNEYEYIAGTDPTDRDSVFAVSDAAWTQNAFNVSWYAITGRLYGVNYNDSFPTGPWTALDGASNLSVVANGYYSVSDSTVDVISNRVYQIKVKLP